MKYKGKQCQIVYFNNTLRYIQKNYIYISFSCKEDCT